MCQCLNDIAEEYSNEYHQNGKDACVYTRIACEVTVTPYVMEKNPYKKKGIRRAKHSKHFGVDLKFCPICGVKKDGYQNARIRT